MSPSQIDLARVREAISSQAPPAPYEGEVEFAVLVALFEEDGVARVLLTRRATHLRRNQGEIAFPGGRVEPGETPTEAALREAFEEVALDPASVELVGELTPLSTVTRPSGIQPIVGVLAGRPTVEANPDEVAEVFDVALSDLCEPAAFREEIWTLPDGSQRPIYFYDVCDPPVWGATARVLKELLDLIEEGHAAK
ncbi:MAG TPA: CoA pyrophosphatase [Acidimicrobiales bacterium]|nr:CoA pyrophosphatase [Acidimicrobiales bacterium]